ncbi:unnamed protein product [Pseudo-nitzschia multistriata]|uniref:Uncharacterized protein n=1 Tax=Pseudo-nitzschia multistriata TaxID=183589 RepID=A0A448ZDU1_9STRA|nr:unnamed protein product [Pseudo-nitzschia multistriata]
MGRTAEISVASNPSKAIDESTFESFCNDESQNTDTQTQMECTQLTQPGLTPDESSNLMHTPSSGKNTPLSPPQILPFGRLVPSMPSPILTAINLMPTQESYWLGRSQKCDVTAQYDRSERASYLSKKGMAALDWGKSMISNRHCRIFHQNNGSQIFVEDNSGNGTFINQQTKLQKGETRILHSGDVICLVNHETLRKRLSSDRIIQFVLQQFSFIVVRVQSKTRKSCVNPRAMNYNFGRNHRNSSIDETGASQLSPLPPSRKIETFYDLREILGDGTSGQVRRAIHRQSGKERAVKIISLRRNVNASMMEREVNLLQLIDHPYIVKLVEVFVERGVAMYLVMELVKGGDLFDCIVEKQRYTEVEARRAMRRLLNAVYYLHEEANIVHRDLKPENILCSSPIHVKLADFGLAKIIKADGLKTFCGTPAYFAPEVLQRRGTVAGRGRYGKPADMWSLGVILYILLTGKPPFDADMDEPSNCYEVDFESDALIWSEIPSAKDLVEKMLRQDPKQRYTVRQACEHTWINVDDGDTHCNPLNDPAVVSKQIGDKQESSKPSEKVCETVANEIIGVKNDKSLHEESTALVASHFQSNSEGKNSSKVKPDSVHNVLRKPERKIADLKISSESNNHEPCGDGEREGKGRNDDVTEFTSSDANAIADNEESSGVSFSDDVCLPPRSPLSKLNLNQRSNKFRDHVMKQTKELFESPNGNGERQSAVTPNLSSIKRQPLQEDLKAEKGDGNVEDPILSQFSSEVSSVESFSDNDSSTNDVSATNETQSEHSSKKRPLDDKETKNSTKASKRDKTCGSKQTTLNAWLVKKT